MIGAVRAVDPEQPVLFIATMEDVLEESLGQRPFAMQLLAAFALLALVLASVGIYSVLAYTVRQRVREIGIRMALGAPTGGVLRLVVIEGLKPTLIGVVLGLMLAAVLVRVMTTLLYGVDQHDPGTFTAVAAIMLMVGIAATCPRTCHRVDPSSRCDRNKAGLVTTFVPAICRTQPFKLTRDQYCPVMIRWSVLRGVVRGDGEAAQPRTLAGTWTLKAEAAQGHTPDGGSWSRDAHGNARDRIERHRVTDLTGPKGDAWPFTDSCSSTVRIHDQRSRVPATIDGQQVMVRFRWRFRGENDHDTLRGTMVLDREGEQSERLQPFTATRRK